jgi:hypothetical protein
LPFSVIFSRPPIFQDQPINPREFTSVGRDHDEAPAQRGSGDHDIEGALNDTPIALSRQQLGRMDFALPQSIDRPSDLCPSGSGPVRLCQESRL